MKHNILQYSFIFTLTLFSFCNWTYAAEKSNWDNINKTSIKYGKPEWQPLLQYTLGLHKKSTHPAQWPFSREWEEIGPGYGYGPAFGHWDIIHQVMDIMPFNKPHALNQLLNNIENQETNGLIPGSIWMKGAPSNREKIWWNKDTQGHPPMWVMAVQSYYQQTQDIKVLKTFYPALVKQLVWFENSRKAEGEGFYYNDIINHKWESGVDDGLRFDKIATGKWASVDATSHVYMMYKHANLWAKTLGFNRTWLSKRETELSHFITTTLWSDSDNMFYDIWAINDKADRHLVFENFSPLITGAATSEQANKLIDLYLLNEKHFLTKHPVPTVAVSSKHFEKRMWRGPAWNSMTYWIAKACVQYGRDDAAKIILERALDMTNYWYIKTGEVWEFYDSKGGNPAELKRKTNHNQPYKQYLGHNPLIAMAELYDKVK